MNRHSSECSVVHGINLFLEKRIRLRPQRRALVGDRNLLDRGSSADAQITLQGRNPLRRDHEYTVLCDARVRRRDGVCHLDRSPDRGPAFFVEI